MLEYYFSDQHTGIWAEVVIILMVQDSISDGVEESKAAFYYLTKIHHQHDSKNKAACLPEQGADVLQYT